MRLATIRIENFRSFEAETIAFDKYTCFVGANGSGKSTILVALNIFFRNSSGSATDVLNLSDEDFHLRHTDKPVRITLTFDSLTAAAADALKAYVRQNQLIVSAVAVFDPVTQRAPVRQVGSRLVIKRFAEYFKAQENKAKAPELKKIYEGIQQDFADLPPPGSMDAMRAALRAYEDANPGQCELVEAETQFYGWSKGEDLLRQFIQWIYLPAVKDPTSEQDESRNTALGAILERTIRSKVTFDEPISKLKQNAFEEYQKILNEQQGALDELTKSLSSKLRVWAHDNTNVALKWRTNDQNAIRIAEPLARVFAGENDFLGELGRLGNGLQRSLLVALLQELAETSEAASDNLILGFEEPELFQHPPQARHMCAVLEDLSKKNTQAIITTHSPYFVSGHGFPHIRMVRNNAAKKTTVVTSYTHEALAKILALSLEEAPRSPTATMAAVEQIMQPSQNELFFTKVAVIVEGLEDIAFISIYLQLSGRWDEFRRLGCHFIISAGKANLSRPLAIAKGLGIPAFAIFDADRNENGNDNVRNNRCILKLCGIPGTQWLPDDIVWGDHLVAWPYTIKKAIIADVGENHWNAAYGVITNKFDYHGMQQKDPLVISATLEELWNGGAKSDVLIKACDSILKFGAAAT